LVPGGKVLCRSGSRVPRLSSSLYVGMTIPIKNLSSYSLI
jgi:hypothetical protein